MKKRNEGRFQGFALEVPRRHMRLPLAFGQLENSLF